MLRFSIGCAVWAYKGWAGTLYPGRTPAGEMLRLYTERFPIVEGNTTFYAVPDAATLDRWSETMPRGFSFFPKLPRDISHQGALAPMIHDARRFVEHMRRLGDRLGPFHLQLPPTYDPELLPDLATFLTQWPHDDARLALELRHPGFFAQPEADQVDNLLERLGVARVVLDTRPVYECSDDPQALHGMRKPRLPLHARVTAPFAMVRFISHPDAARNLPYLRVWARRVHQWLLEGTQVYFFAHCPIEDHSPALAKTFQSLLEQEGAEIPPLDWELLPPPATQQALF